MKKPGIKDIAKAMNLSPAAVSYALSNKGRVSAKTRKAVERVAKRMGFIRDHNAVRLRTGRSNLLGVIVNDISNPYFAVLLDDLEAATRDSGYLTIVATSGDDVAQQEELVVSLLSQGVAGLVVVPAHGSKPADFAAVAKSNRPMVTCVRDIKDDRSSFFGQDDVKAGELVARHLADKGIRRIAYVGGYADTHIRRDRLKGVRRELRRRGLKLPGKMEFPCRPDLEWGELTAAGVIDTHRDIEAVIAHNDNVAVGVYRAVQSAGRRVGRDYSVVGFDNVPVTSALMPPLTTVELNPRTIGRRSVEALIGMLENPGSGPVRELTEPVLVERGSVVRPARRKRAGKA